MSNIITDLKILRKPCEEATEKINVEAMAAALLHDLAKTAGAGLAANQIGFHHKVCVITEETLKALEKRGITPIIIPDGDKDHK